MSMEDMQSFNFGTSKPTVVTIPFTEIRTIFTFKDRTKFYVLTDKNQVHRVYFMNRVESSDIVH